MTFVCPLFLTALLTFPSSGETQDERQELASVQGTWIIDSAHEGGQPFTKERREQAKLTIEGSRFTVKDGQATFRGELTLRFKEKPKGVDAFVEVPGSETFGVLGIYAAERNTLTVCLSKAKRRPVEFKTDFGDSNVVIVFKRKAEEKAPH